MNNLDPSIKLLKFIVSPTGGLDEEQANLEWRVQMLEWAEATLGMLSPGALSDKEVARVREYISDESTHIIADKINYALEHDGSAIVSLKPPGEVSLGALESLLRGIAAQFTQLPDGSVSISAKSKCEDCQDEKCPGHPNKNHKELN